MLSILEVQPFQIGQLDDPIARISASQKFGGSIPAVSKHRRETGGQEFGNSGKETIADLMGATCDDKMVIDKANFIGA